MKRNLLIAALILLVLSVTAWTQTGKPQWEYKIEYNVKEGKLNKLAAEGWDLVAVGAEGDTITLSVFVFKRAK